MTHDLQVHSGFQGPQKPSWATSKAVQLAPLMLQLQCAAISQMISLYPQHQTQQEPLPGSGSAGPAVQVLRHSRQVLLCQTSTVTLYSVAAWVLHLPVNKRREKLQAWCVKEHKKLDTSLLADQLALLT